MMWVCRAPPKQHDHATLADKPRNNTTRPHNNPARGRTTSPHPNTRPHPPHMRARARPISRARALPTNRHEGGSLT